MSGEPIIIGFCCNWCAYAAADLAGTARTQYPASLRIVRVMCTGMVHPEMIVDALNKGADGVMILGCHTGDCHYRDGSLITRSRSELIREILDESGYEKDRFALCRVSSAEPDKFVEAIRRMESRLSRLASAADFAADSDRKEQQ